MDQMFNRVVCGDCLKHLATLPQGDEAVVDLVFADPPFNIGYAYDEYRDNLKYEEYYGWTRQWMALCRDILKPTGSFYVAIGDDYAAEIRMIGRELGLHLRNWIIWHYTFGQSTKAKFARSHTHIFYFVKDEKDFYFDDRAVRVLSDRQKEYQDRRANPIGKLPDDVWTQFPRVCGTFAERLGDHPCQMPESVLARIIRCSCPPAGLVVDPFSGSGTTLVTAAKLGRRYFGTEMSKQYVAAIRKRLDAAAKELSGAAGLGGWPVHHIEELKRLYQENELPTARLVASEVLLECFVGQLNARLGNGATYTAETVRRELTRLRKMVELPKIRSHISEQDGNGEPTLFDAPRRRRSAKPREVD